MQPTGSSSPPSPAVPLVFLRLRQILLLEDENIPLPIVQLYYNELAKEPSAQDKETLMFGTFLLREWHVTRGNLNFVRDMAKIAIGLSKRFTDQLTVVESSLNAIRVTPQDVYTSIIRNLHVASKRENLTVRQYLLKQYDRSGQNDNNAASMVSDLSNLYPEMLSQDNTAIWHSFTCRYILRVFKHMMRTIGTISGNDTSGFFEESEPSWSSSTNNDDSTSSRNVRRALIDKLMGNDSSSIPERKEQQQQQVVAEEDDSITVDTKSLIGHNAARPMSIPLLTTTKSPISPKPIMSAVVSNGDEYHLIGGKENRIDLLLDRTENHLASILANDDRAGNDEKNLRSDTSDDDNDSEAGDDDDDDNSKAIKSYSRSSSTSSVSQKASSLFELFGNNDVVDQSENETSDNNNDGDDDDDDNNNNNNNDNDDDFDCENDDNYLAADRLDLPLLG